MDREADRLPEGVCNGTGLVCPSRDREVQRRAVSRCDYIGSICRLLGVQNDPVVHRRVGCNDDIVGGDDMSIGRCNRCRLAILDALGVCA